MFTLFYMDLLQQMERVEMRTLIQVTIRGLRSVSDKLVQIFTVCNKWIHLMHDD